MADLWICLPCDIAHYRLIGIRVVRRSNQDARNQADQLTIIPVGTSDGRTGFPDSWGVLVPWMAPVILDDMHELEKTRQQLVSVNLDSYCDTEVGVRESFLTAGNRQVAREAARKADPSNSIRSIHGRDRYSG